jgi:hypothetical protein
MILNALAALSLAAQGPVPAPAPTAQAGQSGEIVVTGDRPPTEREIRRHVTETTGVHDDQLSRFARPVCPAVYGLEPAAAAVIEERIRDVVADVAPQRRVGAARAPCRPNLILVLAPDVEAFMEEALRKNLLRDVALSDIRRAAGEEGPVRVWNVQQLVNEDYLAAGSPGGDQSVRQMRVSSASIVTRPVQEVVLGAVVAIDSDAAVGKTLLQLADYAAMRALAETRPPSDGGSAIRTILSLFDTSGAAPPHATRGDLAYLRGLYRAAANRSADQQRARIARLMRRDLDETTDH